ncbi:MAG: 1-acyl-sn-glycerol-3-phosphate acyltransferase [Thermoclostridium sp.]|nr:1-acyl-sn-glycerol-3-phosphate acyltransferase [Thermoclostridium sp.]
MLYRFACWLSNVFFALFYRVSTAGAEKVPKEGTFIVCCNHISLLDMFLFGPRLPMKVHFMAKQELFKIPVLKSILKGLGAYPVKRGQGDMQAAKTTLLLLKEGKTIGIFPEGHRRNKSSGKLKPKSGAILFAVESGVPILPVGIFGNFRLFSKLRVVYGQPWYPVGQHAEKPAKARMQELAEELMEKIYALENQP